MPDFKYKGINSKNKRVKGTMHANTRKELHASLKEENIFVYEAVEVVDKKVKSLYKLKSKELTDFSRQIGTMQGAGIPVIKAIAIMSERDSNPKIKEVYAHILSVINKGNTLSEGMESCNGSFPTLMINMFKAGEVSGRLDESAMKMAKYYEGENKIHGKIRNAMAYPTILAIVTVAVVLILFTFVLPVFLEMYEDNGADLNILTSMLLNFSTFLTTNWLFVTLFSVAALAVTNTMLKLYPVAFQVDKMRLKVPKIGPLVSIIYTARFARTLSSLYSSGITMVEAVEISAKVIGNRYLESQFNAIITKIRAGQSLSQSMEGMDGIDMKLNASIYIGEESGRLDTMLASIAEEYEYEADVAIDRMLTYIEPLMIVIMGLIIGPVLVAVMLPMYGMYTMM